MRGRQWPRVSLFGAIKVVGLAWCLSLQLCLSIAWAGTNLSADFVRLRSVAPDIGQDMRYASAFNFTGSMVPGYRAGECILTREAAAALGRVQTRLAKRGYGLKVYDCYRPARSVRYVVDWVGGSAADPLAHIFHPHIARRDLLKDGYIAVSSAHSRGSTADVGLLRLTDAALPTPGPDSGACDGAFRQRPHESNLDLGTTFDCFSAKSSTTARLTGEAARNRGILRDAMIAEGFSGYWREWWHFTYAKEPFPHTSFDFEVDR